MKKALQLLALMLFATGTGLYAQETVTDSLAPSAPKEFEFFESHKVTMGETIIMVARKYTVSPQDIYEYNKEAIHGITAGQQLLIPLHRSLKEKKKQTAKQQQPEQRDDYVEKTDSIPSQIPEE
ncbi:MAG: LysM peptidoglycan-binding domain-containing protein [Bacteroidota bacterium]